MKNAADRLHSQLNAILNSNRAYLQDAVITMRDGRYCLPVKSEYKNQVAGMVHEIRPLRAIFEDMMSGCQAVVKGLNV